MITPWVSSFVGIHFRGEVSQVVHGRCLRIGRTPWACRGGQARLRDAASRALSPASSLALMEEVSKTRT
jgi:hypothetical protein